MKPILSCLFLLPLLFSLAGCSASNQGITLHYEENAQVELLDGSGQRVLVDVYAPGKLSGAATEKDLLLTTHSHSDHINDAFLKSFSGKELRMNAGELAVGGVKVRGIAGSHSGKAPADLNGSGSNDIYIIEIGGLRVVHFGDLGQDELTPAQLDAIGKVDVAVMQLANTYSSMSLDNKKGFNLLDQVKPRLIIPTHTDEATIKYAVQKWKAAYSDTPLALTSANLPKETTIVLMGDFAKAYGKIYNLPLFK